MLIFRISPFFLSDWLLGFFFPYLFFHASVDVITHQSLIFQLLESSDVYGYQFTNNFVKEIMILLFEKIKF